MEALHQAIALASEEARYHHLLGMSYGRMAEQSHWLKAVPLARRTRQALERAVALDPSFLDAHRDLETYYRTAPAFLGGSTEKADALRLHIESLR